MGNCWNNTTAFTRLTWSHDRQAWCRCKIPLLFSRFRAFRTLWKQTESGGCYRRPFWQRQYFHILQKKNSMSCSILICNKITASAVKKDSLWAYFPIWNASFNTVEIILVRTDAFTFPIRMVRAISSALGSIICVAVSPIFVCSNETVKTGRHSNQRRPPTTLSLFFLLARLIQTRERNCHPGGENLVISDWSLKLLLIGC